MASGIDSWQAPISAYERQAEALLESLQAGEEAAAWEFKWNHPRYHRKHVSEVDRADSTLDDARTVVARLCHFESWTNLEQFTRAVQADPSVAAFEAAVDAVVSGDTSTLRELLAVQPDLTAARSARRHHATLLHYLGSNGVEDFRQKTPPNAVEVARLLLDAGAQVDALADMYDAKCTTMSMLVSSCHPANAGLQVALAELLADYGANLVGAGAKRKSSVMTALQFGYLDTAKALSSRGAPVDDLSTAAGLGLLEECRRFLPDADPAERHAAMAIAAQHGHVDVLELLLDAGEDPDRFNPEGFHSHSTPLHQAALAGHLNVVRLLVERRARLDVRDQTFAGTPLGWAEHGCRMEIAVYLREKMKADDQG